MSAGHVFSLTELGSNSSRVHESGSTPRLNDFLARVRALVEARGGSWRLWVPDENEPWHSEMLTEGGIDLDGQP